jgi:beta-mannanase
MSTASRPLILDLEKAIGRPLAIDNEQVAWAPSDSPAGFPDTDRIAWDIQYGRIPQQSWNVSRELPRGNTDRCANADDIIAGKYDVQLKRQADSVKAISTTIFIRWNQETGSDIADCFYNRGGKVPSDEANNALLGPLYVGAWQHVVDVFRSEGVTNVKWIWAPGTDAYADSKNDGTGTCAPKDRWTYYYPGDSYVDWIAIDHYQKDGSVALSLVDDTCFKSFYTQVSGKGKPLMWAETAANSNSALVPDPQAAWIRSLRTVIPASYPQVKALLWWDLPGSYYQHQHAGFAGSYELSGTGLDAFKVLANTPSFKGFGM